MDRAGGGFNALDGALKSAKGWVGFDNHVRRAGASDSSNDILAGLAAELVFDGELGRPHAGTKVAGHGARARGPGADLAIDRAGVGVACVFLVGVRAKLAAHERGGNSAGAGLDTTSADLVAGGPGGPAADLAVFGASVVVATLVLGRIRRAGSATVKRRVESAGAGLAARAARLRAVAPNTPFTNFAIDRALVGVAVLVLLGRRAGLAVELRGDGGAGAGLFASATSLGASGFPGTPAADDAVDGAELLVARGVFVSVGALLAGEAGGTED